MHRFAAFLFVGLFAAAVLAAPAPRPRPPTPWVTGWDKPVDPSGDCRFDRDGDRLTISVPGKGHELNYERPMTAPQLLRDVEGDFDVQVRVTATFLPVNPLGVGGTRSACILL